MPIPNPLIQPTPIPEPTPILESPPPTKRSRFDMQPSSISMNKRLKTESTPSTNPLSDSDSDSVAQEPVLVPKKNKKKSAFQKYGDAIGQTNEELQRRDRRLQRFEIAERTTPPRVDTPDFVRDAQIAATIV